jgi:hypothetical protein
VRVMCFSNDAGVLMCKRVEQVIDGFQDKEKARLFVFELDGRSKRGLTFAS